MKISVCGEIREAERRVALGSGVVRRRTENHEELTEHASPLCPRNVEAPVRLMINAQSRIALDFDDEVIAGARLTHSVGIFHDGARAGTFVAQGRWSQ
jgi:NAD/NADP transhydrogenase alpha subunit